MLGYATELDHLTILKGGTPGLYVPTRDQANSTCGFMIRFTALLYMSLYSEQDPPK